MSDFRIFETHEFLKRLTEIPQRDLDFIFPGNRIHAARTCISAQDFGGAVDRKPFDRQWLPRSVGERILLCILCSFVALVLLVFVYSIFLWKPDTFYERVLKMICAEILYTLCGLILLGFVWGLFAPSWLEKIIERQSMRAAFWLLILILGTCAAVVTVFLLPGGR